MTRPTNESKKGGDFRGRIPSEKSRSIVLPEGMEFEGDIRIRAVETPAERKHRLRMEVSRFWTQEAPIHVAAVGIAISGTIAALVLMFRPNSTFEEQKWAFSILSHVLIAVAGFAFGKAAK